MHELRVTMLVDPEMVDSGCPDFSKISDPELADMEYHIAASLRRMNHCVQVLALPSSTPQSIRTILSTKPDVVFNLVEHLHHDRMLSPDVPSVLESLNIPYTGCSHIGMSLALDKAASKCLVREAGFRTPEFMVISPRDAVKTIPIRFPLIVKPRFGGGSEAITLSSVVSNRAELRSKARYIHRRLGQPAICEEFIEGREFSVALLGNGADVTALPVRETVFGGAAMGGPTFCTEKVKSSAAYRKRWGITYGRADLPPAKESEILERCRRAYIRLELSGYARIDLRLTREGEPVFLEANPNPDLSPRIYGIIASFAGMDYDTLLSRILDLAITRKPAGTLKKPKGPRKRR